MAYPDGTARMEKVHQQHPVLEIDYWRANGSGPWYFEDPITGAVTRAGSDKKLRKALSKRNFWWLETDEDVTVTCNRDGSKSYEYKGLTNPVEITQLLELESKQVEIEANKPVSKWKAGALAAMSLLGNSMGLQALVKNSVPTAEPESPKPQSNSTTLKALRLLNKPAPASSQTPGNQNNFVQNSFFDAAYFSGLGLRGLQMASVVLSSAAAAVRPSIGRRQGVTPLGALMAMVMGSSGGADALPAANRNQKKRQILHASSDAAELEEADTETGNTDVEGSEAEDSEANPLKMMLNGTVDAFGKGIDSAVDAIGGGIDFVVDAFVGGIDSTEDSENSESAVNDGDDGVTALGSDYAAHSHSKVDPSAKFDMSDTEWLRTCLEKWKCPEEYCRTFRDLEQSSYDDSGSLAGFDLEETLRSGRRYQKTPTKSRVTLRNPATPGSSVCSTPQTKRSQVSPKKLDTLARKKIGEMIILPRFDKVCKKSDSQRATLRANVCKDLAKLMTILDEKDLRGKEKIEEFLIDFFDIMRRGHRTKIGVGLRNLLSNKMGSQYQDSDLGEPAVANEIRVIVKYLMEMTDRSSSFPKLEDPSSKENYNTMLSDLMNARFYVEPTETKGASFLGDGATKTLLTNWHRSCANGDKEAVQYDPQKNKFSYVDGANQGQFPDFSSYREKKGALAGNWASGAGGLFADDKPWVIKGQKGKVTKIYDPLSSEFLKLSAMTIDHVFPVNYIYVNIRRLTKEYGAAGADKQDLGNLFVKKSGSFCPTRCFVEQALAYEDNLVFLSSAENSAKGAKEPLVWFAENTRGCVDTKVIKTIKDTFFPRVVVGDHPDGIELKKWVISSLEKCDLHKDDVVKARKIVTMAADNVDVRANDAKHKAVEMWVVAAEKISGPKYKQVLENFFDRLAKVDTLESAGLSSLKTDMKKDLLSDAGFVRGGASLIELDEGVEHKEIGLRLGS